MGQIVKRKKGRPKKADSGVHAPPEMERDLRRSHRRRNVKYFFDLDDYFDDDEIFENDEDQRRKQKQLELILKLEGGEELETAIPQPSRTRRVDQLPSTSTSSFEDGGKPSKKRKIGGENDEVNVADSYNDQNDKVGERKPASIAQDSSPDAPSVIPLPDKKALELILDKLQKKDIYGVYAEPVDSKELPDYYDLIEHPMDFATVRSKLRNGSYETLEQFESDVFLICSNAMQYNEPHTVYYKQARSIKELATKKFHKIRSNAEFSKKHVEPDQKMGYNTSTFNMQMKNSVRRMVQESLGSDFSYGATLATAVNTHSVPNVPQAFGSIRTGNSDFLVEGNSFLNYNNFDRGEESLPGKGPLSRSGRKSFVHCENPRAASMTTSLAHPETTSDSILSTFEGERKHLVPVGLSSDNSYARSLACFAATLGSVAWKVASKKIKQALPQGVEFGRGWVGEYEPLPTPLVMQVSRVSETEASKEVSIGKNRFDSNTIASSSSDVAKAATFLSSAASSSGYNSSSAAVAASRVWMSVGAQGFAPAGKNINLHKNQIYPNSSYNSTRDNIQPIVAQNQGEMTAFGGMHVQRETTDSPLHALVAQSPQAAFRVGNEMRFNNESMIHPHIQQSSWRNLGPQMHYWQKQELLPPELNVGFQSLGSLGMPSLLVDSPDLALQL